MSKKFYKIEPDLNDDQVAFIDDWEFSNWPNKPKSEIVKNPDGTFSVIMEKDFIPLIRKLQNLFTDGEAPENGTYLGEAVLSGKNEPLDIIYGNFINKEKGLVISDQLLEIMKKYQLPTHFIYALPLIRKKKRYNGYSYIYFKKSDSDYDHDVRLIFDKYKLFLAVSENLKEELIGSDVKGCIFTYIN